MESDTPRTDAENYIYDIGQVRWVSIEFARQLERELAAAKAELAASTAESIDLFRQLVAMRQQRDEARIRVCELCARMGGVYRRINREVVECKTPEEIAEVCGWDCFAKKEGGGA